MGAAPAWSPVFTGACRNTWPAASPSPWSAAGLFRRQCRRCYRSWSPKGRRRRREEHRSSVDAVVNGLNVQSQIPRSDLYQLDEAWVALLRRWQQLDQWFPSLDWGKHQRAVTRRGGHRVFSQRRESSTASDRFAGVGGRTAVVCAAGWDQRLSATGGVLAKPVVASGMAVGTERGLGSRAEVMSRSLRLIQNWRTLVGQLSASLPTKQRRRRGRCITVAPCPADRSGRRGSTGKSARCPGRQSGRRAAAERRQRCRVCAPASASRLLRAGGVLGALPPSAWV